MSARLVDEFRVEISRRGLSLPGELAECGVIADLLWEPAGDSEYIRSRANEDPAFLVTGYSRCVAFARIRGEIRFHATPIPQGAQSWWWTGEDSKRVAAVKAEPDYQELKIVATVADAVILTMQYLTGIPLADIEVVRIASAQAR